MLLNMDVFISWLESELKNKNFNEKVYSYIKNSFIFSNISERKEIISILKLMNKKDFEDKNNNIFNILKNYEIIDPDIDLNELIDFLIDVNENLQKYE